MTIVIFGILMTFVINCVKSLQQKGGMRMRVSKEKAAENHQQILRAAARLFRERGISATGVDSITKEAGLTHGGLYSQFGSKEAIATEAIRFASSRAKRIWERLAQRKPGKKIFPEIVAEYLSPAHRDAPGNGCVVAALGADIARQPSKVREAFTAETRKTLGHLAEQMPGDNAAHRRENAIAAFSCMVGGLILARAVSDVDYSDLILRSAAQGTIEMASRRRRGRSAS
jgi:TetR/AcrR family transcriptional regulator, transcriptional repressor for nem operon